MAKILVSYAVTTSLYPTYVKAKSCGCLFRPSRLWTDDFFNVVISNELVTEGWFRRDESIGDGANHNLARMRNNAFKCATESGVDWLVTLDADSIFLGVTKFPSTGYGKLDVFFQKEGEPVYSLNFEDKSRWSKASWWIFHRDIFSNPALRHDEAYLGQHGADWDFMENVLKPAGIVESETDAAAIHLWHPSRENKAQHAANMLRYEEKRKARGA